MTPAEAVAKWRLGAPNINGGDAADFICPKCGSREEFHIGAKGTVVLTGHGETTSFYAVELGSDDFCKCGKCGFNDAVPDFKVPGLNAYLIAAVGLG